MLVCYHCKGIREANSSVQVAQARNHAHKLNRRLSQLRPEHRRLIKPKETTIYRFQLMKHSEMLKPEPSEALGTRYRVSLDLYEIAAYVYLGDKSGLAVASMKKSERKESPGGACPRCAGTSPLFPSKICHTSPIAILSGYVSRFFFLYRSQNTSLSRSRKARSDSDSQLFLNPIAVVCSRAVWIPLPGRKQQVSHRSSASIVL